ncbi:hypothetical protein M427DRAFT_41976 [Gonapodya prolifera JEL478]|uniref:Ankyrin n=1 Tax=Gonapodya prolifera (strain JEL478) TaxID=1344416 RepID=A0A139AQY1_GONPJ|nr:hypothetical protein M427DRAFT_41976 [Gonapodya prolifera JEL478]|eukprot:KXS19129.1 hypothetical protein M427DRAFT_41976 [Gonapodya prolifera JEL478]
MTQEKDQSPIVDANLLDAIEKNDLAAVEAALLSGANPDTRKSITLSCFVYPSWDEDDFGEVVGIGNPQLLSDTVLGETALALAIVRAKSVQIVTALLNSGANPDAPPSWRLPATNPVWCREDWDQRWSYTLSFPSLLALAMARGGRAIEASELPAYWQDELDSGRVRVSKPGAVVHFEGGDDFNLVCDEALLAPRKDLVEVLLSHGARVVDADLSAARSTGYDDVVAMVEAAFEEQMARERKQGPASNFAIASGETVENKVSALLGERAELRQRNEDLERKNEVLTRELAEVREELEALRAELKAKDRTLAEGQEML